MQKTEILLDRSLMECIEAKRTEIESQQILEGLKEAVEDVKSHRISGIDTLWESVPGCAHVQWKKSVKQSATGTS